ncbi:signal peptide peptidase SppA [Puteibacter caeruleilacunae]|nr:signal peptide peptidase SppA [Puteibacter caeruleilacunae]
MGNFLKYTLASILGVLIAGLLLFFISMGIISAIVAAGDEPVQVKDNSILVIKLEDEIVDRSSKNPFDELDLPGFSGRKQMGLNDILANIKKAKKDSRIKGIYLNMTNVASGVATIEEIRDALIDFKESDKFIYSFSDVYSQKAYYLASVADSIVLNPEGILEFKGLGGQKTFFKNALKKIGVEMQIVRHGKFKSAVEPYMLEKMSDANREQTETYLGSIWNHFLKGISKERELGIDQLNDLANGVVTFQKPQVALDGGLIDGLKYKDQVLSDLRTLIGIGQNKKIPAISLGEYTNAPVKRKGGLARDKVAVIYASGGIDMGEGEGNMSSEEISRAIRKARTDSTIKAVVLRINSGGGSALGSEIMWREVKLTREVKPIIASFGDYAASGGYYMACSADTIVASPTTITGSIGIFGVIPNAGELLNDKLGITHDVVKTNDHSDMISIVRPMTTFERNLMQKKIEDGYLTFISHVADGRGLTVEKVDEIGQGRVWSGENASTIGLVDVFGGLDKAIEIAKDKAGLERYRIVSLPKQKDPIEELLKSFTQEARMSVMQDELGVAYKYYSFMKKAASMNGAMAVMPYELEIN